MRINNNDTIVDELRDTIKNQHISFIGQNYIIVKLGMFSETKHEMLLSILY